jgi:predicted transcriptional regulator of viral defense system
LRERSTWRAPTRRDIAESSATAAYLRRKLSPSQTLRQARLLDQFSDCVHLREISFP